MEIKAVILAAGKGTRMKSNTPKVLHKIFEKPLLGYVLDNVKNIVNESFVIVGHHAEEVTEYVQKEYKNAKTVLQTPQLGTGHAVSMVCPSLENFDGQVIILCGDTPLITEDTLKKFIDYHNSNNSDLTVMSTIFENPANYGRIIREKDNSLKCIVEEKDATPEQKAVKEVNAGIYCLNWNKIKQAFCQLTSNNAQGEYYLTDIIEWGKKNNLNVNAYIMENNEEIYGINSRSNLATATKLMNKRKLNKLMDNGVTIVDPDSTWISEDTEIGADTTIYPATYIEGKNKIGNNCKIGPCAHLRGDVEIADNCKIGNFVEVKKAKIDHNTNAGHLSYIGDCEIGSNVNIGAGTITANYNPLTKVKSKTVLKNDVKIGSNTVLVAPVEVEEGTNVGAGSVITKNLPSWALAITRAPLRIIENWVRK
ncbi:TPA: bifunctional N-acetylglucosamine-1-phosphate uridyltransferase/glucosamine-1-phosphate acetyltransferase [Candidatus Gastranaerophilales bacterium HUM_20]|nr:bifunctional protein GlmU [Clostridium sp. CAG:729]DAB19399.1 MAG TPA: bifunctional N-acetylglucosamine-1-phosphate uridyltransferase/glucosamine-1-phosphate acetyltransferase [Candidatus Gastranaerophilales bacterium HUM_20]